MNKLEFPKALVCFRCLQWTEWQHFLTLKGTDTLGRSSIFFIFIFIFFVCVCGGGWGGGGGGGVGEGKEGGGFYKGDNISDLVCFLALQFLLKKGWTLKLKNLLQKKLDHINLGPVFQRIVSLRTNLLTVVARVFSHTLIFLLQKCE